MAEMRDQVLRKLRDDAQKEGLSVNGLYEVRIRQRKDQHITEIIRWMLDPSRGGRFDYWSSGYGWAVGDDPMFVFVMTDQNTAMEFKLTWG